MSESPKKRNFCFPGDFDRLYGLTDRSFRTVSTFSCKFNHFFTIFYHHCVLKFTFDAVFFLDNRSNDLNQLVLTCCLGSSEVMRVASRWTMGLERGVDKRLLFAISCTYSKSISNIRLKLFQGLLKPSLTRIVTPSSVK